MGILVVIIVVIISVLVYASTKPDTFYVERRISIQAKPEKIFPYLDDLHKWNEWSPWAKMDPNPERIYTGPATGVGAKFAWKGNSKIGIGSMEIVEANAPSKIVIRLEFIKPFEGSSTAQFTLIEQQGMTEVIWSNTGPVKFIGKVVSLFLNCEKMIGKNLEEGLAGIKALAEK